MDQFKLNQVASDMGMSVSNLQRVFRASYGQTIGEYIRQRRLEIARDAIVRERKSIGEAAYLAGYLHTSNFTNAFKRLFGVPPGTLNDER